MSVFLSYRRQDDEVNQDNALRVRRIQERLTERGIRVFLDDKSLLIGDNLPVKITKAIEDHEFFLPCITEAYIDRVHDATKSNYCQKEFLYASTIKSEKMIALVLEDSCKDISKWRTVGFEMCTKIFVDFSKEEEFEAKIQSLVEKIIPPTSTSPFDSLPFTTTSIAPSVILTSPTDRVPLTSEITEANSKGATIHDPFNVPTSSTSSASLKTREETNLQDWFQRLPIPHAAKLARELKQNYKLTTLSQLSFALKSPMRKGEITSFILKDLTSLSAKDRIRSELLNVEREEIH